MGLFCSLVTCFPCIVQGKKGQNAQKRVWVARFCLQNAASLLSPRDVDKVVICLGIDLFGRWDAPGLCLSILKRFENGWVLLAPRSTVGARMITLHNFIVSNYFPQLCNSLLHYRIGSKLLSQLCNLLRCCKAHHVDIGLHYIIVFESIYGLCKLFLDCHQILFTTYKINSGNNSFCNEALVDYIKQCWWIFNL